MTKGRTILTLDANLHGAPLRAALRLIRKADDRVIHRDLSLPMPSISDAWVTASLKLPEERTPIEAARLLMSDRMVDELMQADILLFGLSPERPASLWHWFDQVARPGLTFRYGAGGLEGLMSGRRAIAILAPDHADRMTRRRATQRLEHGLSLIGIDDLSVQDTMNVPGLEGGDPLTLSRLLR